MQHLTAACTLNLHQMVCHLPQQEKARGCLSQDTEFFVERSVQKLKSVTRDRLSRQPALVYAAHASIGIALASMKAMHPAAALGFDELCPGRAREPTIPLSTMRVGQSAMHTLSCCTKAVSHLQLRLHALLSLLLATWSVSPRQAMTPTACTGHGASACTPRS